MSRNYPIKEYSIDQSNVTNDDFDRVRLIGEGKFSRVYLVIKKDTKERFALKVIKEKNLKELKQISNVKIEINILKYSDHPFITKLYYAFIHKDDVCIVMELNEGGELYKQISYSKRLQSDCAKFYAAQVVLAIEYLHSNEILMRDMKPENLMLNRHGYIRLIDFGLSKNNITDNLDTNTFCGTTQYLAPEILNRGGHGLAVDLWCLGCLIYEMHSGDPPFNFSNLSKLSDSINKNELKFPSYVDDDIKSIVRGLLVLNPDARLGSNCNFNELKGHPYFSQINFDKLITQELEAPWKPTDDEVEHLKWFSASKQKEDTTIEYFDDYD